MASSSSRSTRKPAKGDYIETDSGNKVSRRALISGTPNITLAGRTVLMPDVHLRGDLTRTKPSESSSTSKTAALSSSTTTTTAGSGTSAKPAESSSSSSSTAISIGKSTIISTSTILRPPTRQSRGTWTAYPLKIGDNVFVGPNSMVSAAQIHAHVHIGARCVLLPFCIVREHVRVLDDSVIPAGMVVPPGVVVGGRPARIVGEVGEGWGVVVGGGGPEEWVEGGDLRGVVRSIK